MSDPRQLAVPLPPYAAALGIICTGFEGDAPLLACDFTDRVIGRPGFFQGGAISGLLEMAALSAVQETLAQQGRHARLKPVNVSVQFMRGAGPQRLFALGLVERAGRRMVNVTALAWQEDRARPVASAWMNVMLGAEAAR